MKVESIRIFIGMGDNDLISDLVQYFTRIGGLKIMKWLIQNYEEIVLHEVRSEEGENVLAIALLGVHLDIIEWLMDSCKLTTYVKSPLQYALTKNHPSFSIVLWLLKTGRTSNVEIQSELKHAIEKMRWITATGLIEKCKANIDEGYLWNSVDWSKMATDNCKHVKLFLRALLPRIDFPSHVSEILMNTSSSSWKDGKKIFIHRQMVLDGKKVRGKVKKFEMSRLQAVERLGLPEDLMNDMLDTHLGDDKQMGLSTEAMWSSIHP
jgi:hypothetical protein